MVLQELTDLDFWQPIVVVRAQCTLQFLVLMVLNRYIAVVRGRSCTSFLLPKVDVIEATVWLAASQGVPVLALTSLRVVIVKHIKVTVPRCTDQIVLLTPVDETRDVAILLLDIPLLGSVFLVVVRLLEALLGHSVFNVDAVGTASLVTDEKFSLALI